MKFLLDANVAKSVTHQLRALGFDVEHVVELGRGTAHDEEVLALAMKDGRVIITHDRDFGNLIRFPLSQHCGVIFLRLKNQQPSNVWLHMRAYLAVHADIDLTSRLVIIREGRVRIIAQK